MSEQQPDIVQRLSRRPATTPADQSLLADAADTITALRAELSRLQAGGQGVGDLHRDAALWRYVRHHWSNAQMSWNMDEGNTLKSITLTIKTAHQAKGAPEIERELLRIIGSEAHPPAAPAQSCPEACRTVEKCCNFGYQKQPAAPALVPLNLPEPFGYISQCMLTTPQFMGATKRADTKDEPVYTLSQIRWACTMAGLTLDDGGRRHE